VAKEMGLPLAVEINVLHDDELHPEDRPLRMQYCEWQRQQHTADALYENILWSDEECFARGGVFNVHIPGHGITLMLPVDVKSALA
jgi:hypothetical protein